MRVLVACEESQEVCKAFRATGHEAYSCDLVPCSGGHPEWHIQADALEIIKIHWDLVIAHPPCTYLTSAGAVNLFNDAHEVIDKEREEKGWQAKEMFLRFLNEANADRVAVENPAPMKHFGLPKFDQIIEPYYFGDPWKKRTCLWLRGLPPLQATNVVKPKGCWVSCSGKHTRTKLLDVKGHRNPKTRSKTFSGIAKAMADQWGGEVIMMKGWV